MARGFENKKLAAEAGSKSKRGPAKKPQELRMVLIDGVTERVPDLWAALDRLLEDKPRDYLRYLLEVAKMVIPKDLKLSGEVKLESDARARLIERLSKKIEEANDSGSD